MHEQIESERSWKDRQNLLAVASIRAEQERRRVETLNRCLDSWRRYAESRKPKPSPEQLAAIQDREFRGILFDSRLLQVAKAEQILKKTGGGNGVNVAVRIEFIGATLCATSFRSWIPGAAYKLGIVSWVITPTRATLHVPSGAAFADVSALIDSMAAEVGGHAVKHNLRGWLINVAEQKRRAA